MMSDRRSENRLSSKLIRSWQAVVCHDHFYNLSISVEYYS